jgi:hypothetical protein
MENKDCKQLKLKIYGTGNKNKVSKGYLREGKISPY